MTKPIFDYITKKTNAVYDYEFIKAFRAMPWGEWFETQDPLRCREQYLMDIDQWIHSSKLNQVVGLERFEQRHLINGTTQTFDEAYWKYAHRRLRIYRGEYAYHKRIFKNFVFIEDEPLKEGDWVIVSAPFCSTGDVHPEMYEMFDQAARLKVPVILDCAYYGTCTDFQLDVTYPAIESVSFSLTKGIGLGDIRSGVRYSNIDDMNPIAQQNHYNHTVLAAARIGIYMMERFSPDHIPTKYRKHQLSVCEEAEITPTKCMHLALGDERWDDYKIDDKFNRLGIRELVKARSQGRR